MPTTQTSMNPIVLIATVLCAAVVSASAESMPELTDRERSWIRDHPEISVAATPDWPPFEFVDKRSLIFGPPEYAVDKLLELRETLNIEQVNIKCGWPGMTQDQIMQSLVLFAEKVLPEIQTLEKTTNVSNA